MTTTQALQNLHDELRRLMDQAKVMQGNVQHLRGAKKEADITKRRHEVLATLKTMQDAMAQFQEHMRVKQNELERVLNEDEDRQVEQTQDVNKPSLKAVGIIEARKLSPEQQESLYELKASRMGAMKSQNKALRDEVMLNQRKKQLLDARFAKTQSYSGSETLRAAHALEAKVRGAALKIRGLEDELRKSQQMALRYRELYEDNQRQSEGSQAALSGGGSQGHYSQSATPKLKPAPVKEQSFIGPNTSVNDVVRKNECLLEENDVQKREIQRLKRDNAELLILAKTAATDRETIFARLGTSESARQDLHKRFQKLRKENTQLSRSFTRQTATWIDMKKQQQQTETLDRWGEIYPVAPHGSKERFHEHTQKENTSLPRQMFPVESYGGTSTA